MMKGRFRGYGLGSPLSQWLYEVLARKGGVLLGHETLFSMWSTMEVVSRELGIFLVSVGLGIGSLKTLLPETEEVYNLDRARYVAPSSPSRHQC